MSRRASTAESAAARVREFLRQYASTRGTDPSRVTSVWTDPSAAPAPLEVADLLVLIAAADEATRDLTRADDARWRAQRAARGTKP